MGAPLEELSPQAHSRQPSLGGLGAWEEQEVCVLAGEEELDLSALDAWLFGEPRGAAEAAGGLGTGQWAHACLGHVCLPSPLTEMLGGKSGSRSRAVGMAPVCGRGAVSGPSPGCWWCLELSLGGCVLPWDGVGLRGAEAGTPREGSPFCPFRGGDTWSLSVTGSLTGRCFP